MVAQLPRLYTAVEAAEYLRMTPAEVVRKCREKELRASKPARVWLIAEPDLLNYLAAKANIQQQDVA